MAAMVARVTLDHIARQSNDIRRLADFYIETFGFEEVESPKIGPLKVIWLSLPSGFTIHLIESNPSYPPNQRNDTSPGADPARIPRGHHMCFSVSNFETFVQTLKIHKEQDKIKVFDVLSGATAKSPTDKAATRQHAKGEVSAKLRNKPDTTISPGEVAASVTAAARLNENMNVADSFSHT